MFQTSKTFAAYGARGLAAALALATLVAAPVAAAEGSYVVSATISHDGATIAQPEMRVATDATATVAVTGDDAYEMSILLRPADDPDEVSVQVELATSHGRVESTSTATVGETLTIARGDVGLEVRVTRDDR